MKKYIKIMAVTVAAVGLCSCSSNESYYDTFYEVSEETEAPTELDTSFLEEFMDNYANGKYDIDTESDNEASDKRIDDILKGLEDEEATEAAEKSADDPTEVKEEQTEAPTEKLTGKSEEKTESPKNEKTKAAYELAGCIDVPFRSQSDMPTGCELVSTTMLLNYYGFDIEPYSLIEDGYILTEKFEEKDGVLYGGDPNKRYIGDPRTKSGYGCYSGTIIDGLERFFKDDFFDVYDLNGLSMNDLCKQYIDFDQPVLIWVSIGMGDIYYDDKSEWTVKDTGKKFTWLSNEHCVVLVGYDDDFYYIHDPLKKAYTAYERELVDKRYEEMGRQAVTIIEW